MLLNLSFSLKIRRKTSTIYAIITFSATL